MCVLCVFFVMTIISDANPPNHNEESWYPQPERTMTNIHTYISLHYCFTGLYWEMHYDDTFVFSDTSCLRLRYEAITCNTPSNNVGERKFLLSVTSRHYSAVHADILFVVLVGSIYHICCDVCMYSIVYVVLCCAVTLWGRWYKNNYPCHT